MDDEKAAVETPEGEVDFADESNGDILKPPAAAKLLGLSENQLLCHVRAGRIPGMKLAGTRWRFSRRQLIAHIEAGEQA